MTFMESRAQEFNSKDLQSDIHYSISRAYAASVRIWAFDTVRNARTGPQFTGVVVTPDGHILTAAHVNMPGTTYKVMFPDGRSTIAVGRGEIELENRTFMPDVAMLKIVNEGSWPFANMGHSATLAKGMLAISIAYPETLDQPLPMVRMGEIYDVHNEYGFIQSTCLMEPGDSGGPLFDASGNVIGIHSAVDVSEKENFEVPVDLYRKYWTALQQPKTYSAYPDLKDSIPLDIDTKKRVYSALDNLDQSIKRKPELLRSAVLISSRFDGTTAQIRGVLLDLKGLKHVTKYNGASLVLSKSSYVGKLPEVQLAGETLPASIVARDKVNDLVLLAVKKNFKGGVKIANADTTAIGSNALGDLLVSAISNDQHRISVLGSKAFEMQKIESVGYLGAAVSYFGLPQITETSSSTSSEQAFQKGDMLLAMNGIKLGTRADFLRESKKYWPGDSIKVEISRAGNNIVLQVVLGTRPDITSQHQAERFEGGKSRRRDGFPVVFAHDAALKPEMCGSAVFDLKGKFYGINIARSSRVSNLILPASVVLQFVQSALDRKI